ncbi:pathogenicity-like protein [Pseudoxanthomonas kalamensis DSM 18571]|uniref:putative signal transducing protein n=1 Tax=Pseudoxanthomonas kalamensis TaxID=289483 RepID=UPI001390E442|nr:DUF2007 domain-containing protein [Pseudoxanthomonas kalamensis]KAF1709353.1 pathogenicity-like protein [Pseudoxanthomonas kalamensis DSM 18571]
MRQVFTSQRLETVEGVGKLLTDAGIEIYIHNGRSYRGGRGGQFSYSEPLPAHQQPSLWVRHADDQPRARGILRAAGLLDSTRRDQAVGLQFRSELDAPKPGRWAWRLRLLLLAAIAGLAMLMWLRHRTAMTPAPTQEPPTQSSPAANDENRVRIRPASG